MSVEAPLQTPLAEFTALPQTPKLDLGLRHCATVDFRDKIDLEFNNFMQT